MIIEFRIILKLLNLLKDLKPLEAFEILRFIINTNNNEIVRFVFNDVDFFNSFYKSKTIDIILIIKYFNKNIFFRNIYIFVNRVKNVVRIQNNILLR